MTPPHRPRYRVHPSPIGDILIVATEDGIVTLHPFDGPLHNEIERVALRLRALPVPDGVGSETHAESETDADTEAQPEADTDTDTKPDASARSDADAGLDQHELLARTAAQLDEYFDGDRRAFDLPLDWRLVRGFTRAALEAVCDIPYGETAGYGEVAIAAGTPRAARAVGTACATTPFSVVVPVHRVVRSDGSLGEYGGRPEVKRYLIDLEQAAGV